MKKNVRTILAGFITELMHAGLSSCSNGSNDSTGDNDPLQTAKNYKAYEVTLNRDATSDEVSLLLQIDNDGSKNANGLKIKITDLELSVKVGDANATTLKKDSVELIPNQWASPEYSKNDARFRLNLENNVFNGTKITIQVKKATVDNKAKINDIIFALQSDTKYDMLAQDSEMWKPIFTEE